MATQRPGAQEWVPPDGDVAALRAAAPGCRGCELWADATQVVFSAGDAPARLVLVGEQPGDREDRTGEPFVGPAGRVLDEALAAAGIARGEDRKSTRLNSSHVAISYAVFCLKQKHNRH